MSFLTTLVALRPLILVSEIHTPSSYRRGRLWSQVLQVPLSSQSDCGKPLHLPHFTYPSEAFMCLHICPGSLDPSRFNIAFLEPSIFF